jgi:hypothetical protein
MWHIEDAPKDIAFGLTYAARIEDLGPGDFVKVPMTNELNAGIRATKSAEPHLSQAEIGRRLYINPGRVSEALRGKRA